MVEEKTFTLYEAVRKLTGNVLPVGDANADEERLSNLHEYITLINGLVNTLIHASKYRARYESSMKRIGEDAFTAIKQLSENLNEYLEDK